MEVLVLLSGTAVVSSIAGYGAPRVVYSLPFSYVLGTVVFLLPGALLTVSRGGQVSGTAYGVVLLSIALFVCGWLIARGQNIVPSFGSSRPDLSTWRVTTTELLALLALAVVIKITVDSSTWLAPVLNIRRPESVGEEYLHQLAAVPVGLACIAPTLWYVTRDGEWKKRLIIILLALTGVFGLSRTPFVYVVGSIVVTYVLMFPRAGGTLGRIKRLGLVILALPVLVWVASFYKSSHLILETLQASNTTLSARHLTTTADIATSRLGKTAQTDTYNNLEFIVSRYPEQYNYRPALTAGTLLMAPIPREIFEWKPQTASHILTVQKRGQRARSRGTSLAPSIVGELWMNAGWVGVATGSMLLGLGLVFMVRGLKWILRRHWVVPIGVINCYAVVLVMCWFIPRGDSLVTIFRGSKYLTIAIAAVLFLSIRGRRVHSKSTE